MRKRSSGHLAKRGPSTVGCRLRNFSVIVLRQQESGSQEGFKPPIDRVILARWGSQTPCGGKDHPGGLISESRETRRAEIGRKPDRDVQILPSLLLVRTLPRGQLNTAFIMSTIFLADEFCVSLVAL